MKTLLTFCCLLFANLLLWGQKTPTITYNGLGKTKAGFVDRILKSNRHGDLDTFQFNREMIFLRSLPAFSYVDYDPKYRTSDTIYYNFEESFTFLPVVNLWSAADQLAFRLGFQEYNFLGQGITLGAAYQYTDAHHSYFLDFKIPFLYRKFGLSANMSLWNSEEPLYLDDQPIFYDYRNNSYEAGIFYTPDFYQQFSISGNIFTEEYNYESGEIQFLPEYLKERKYGLKLYHRYAKEKWYYYHTYGWSNSANFQIVKTVGLDPLFYIFRNDLIYYKKVSAKDTWATRLRLGIATNNNSPFSPFELDNHINIRGVGDRVDRGSGALVLNTEWRSVFYENSNFAIQGVAFSDLGTWRQPGGSFEDFMQVENVYWHLGGGIRLIYRKAFNTIFRVDYGHDVIDFEDGGIVLGVGQYF